jgi:hypothetical protein
VYRRGSGSPIRHRCCLPARREFNGLPRWGDGIHLDRWEGARVRFVCSMEGKHAERAQCVEPTTVASPDLRTLRAGECPDSGTQKSSGYGIGIPGRLGDRFLRVSERSRRVGFLHGVEFGPVDLDMVYTAPETWSRRHDGIRLPILLITGSPTPDMIVRASQLGIERVLDKPTSENELIEFIEGSSAR